MKIEMIKYDRIETVYHEKFSFPTNCKKEKKEKSWNVSKISFHLHNIKITENIRLGCVSSKKTNRSKTRNLGWYVQRKTVLLYVTTSREYRVRMLLTTLILWFFFTREKYPFYSRWYANIIFTQTQPAICKSFVTYNEKNILNKSCIVYNNNNNYFF